jgi:hypothetical protein
LLSFYPPPHCGPCACCLRSLLRASGMEEGVAFGQKFRFTYVCGRRKEIQALLWVMDNRRSPIAFYHYLYVSA